MADEKNQPNRNQKPTQGEDQQRRAPGSEQEYQGDQQNRRPNVDQETDEQERKRA